MNSAEFCIFVRESYIRFLWRKRDHQIFDSGFIEKTDTRIGKRDKLELRVFQSEMSKHGFVTFCDNNNYAKGALVLARSLRHVGTSADLVCLITNKVGDEMRSQVSEKLETELNIL